MRVPAAHVLSRGTHHVAIATKQAHDGTGIHVYMCHNADKARDLRTGGLVALKRVRFERSREGVPVTSVRELRVLQQCKHPNIVNLLKVVTGNKPDRCLASCFAISLLIPWAVQPLQPSDPMPCTKIAGTVIVLCYGCFVGDQPHLSMV